MKWLKYALHNIGRNKRRSSVTILITIVGTMAILISSGFVFYTYSSLIESSARRAGHVTLAHPDYFHKDEQKAMEFGLSNYKALSEKWMTHPDVKVTLPRINFNGLITNGDKSVTFIGVGVLPKEMQVKGPFMTMHEGKVLSFEKDAEPHVMLASGLAKSMGASVGSYITLLSTTSEGALNAFDFRVRGIFSVGTPAIDKRLLFTNIGSAQELLQTDKVSSLAIHLYETEGTAKFYSEVLAEAEGLGVQPWWDNAPFYQNVKSLYDLIFGVMGVIILVLVFFSVSNTVSMSVVERTREIGTLAALGTTSGQITRIFILEAMMMGVIGTVIGMIVSMMFSGGVILFDVHMPPPPGRSESYPLRLEMSLAFFVATSGVLIFSAVIASWIAARKGAKQSIVGALAHV